MGIHEKKWKKADEKFSNSADLREAFLYGFDYYEIVQTEENKKSMWWAIGSFIAIIGLSIFIRTLTNENVIFGFSLVTIGIIVFNAYHFHKWLGKIWAMIISLGVAVFFLFLGLKYTTLSKAFEIWQDGVKKKWAGIEVNKKALKTSDTLQIKDVKIKPSPNPGKSK
ncbi:MAG TPA: hypothetical protein VK476_06905 [Flavobacterium sp.]|nr:hypothetical protein [Flavobacterium sp.]